MSTLDSNVVQTTGSSTAAIICRVESLDAAWHDHLSQRYWDWRQLYDRAVIAAPLQHPDYVLGEIRHAPPTKLPAVVILAEQDGRCVGIAALVPKVCQTRRLGSLVLNQQVTGLLLAGNDVLLAEPNPAVTSALVDAVLKHVVQSGAAFLLTEDLDSQTALAQAIETHTPANWLPFRHAGIQPRRRIQLPATAAEYWERFSTKTRSTFRRKLKKFGTTRLECITDVAQVPRFLDIAHQISLQTWQSRQLGLRVRNSADEVMLLSILAREGLLWSYLWLSNDEPVAFLIGNQHKGCFHYEEVGYATPFAKNSPGQMMLIQVMDDLFAKDRPEWFDFGGGDADYKQLFASHESRSGTLWLWPPSLNNLATVNYVRGCRRVRQTARRAVVTLGMASRARQWVRYGWNRLTRSKSTAVTAPTSSDNE